MERGLQGSATSISDPKNLGCLGGRTDLRLLHREKGDEGEEGGGGGQEGKEGGGGGQEEGEEEEGDQGDRHPASKGRHQREVGVGGYYKLTL